jgi:hypothetical protein
MSRPFEDPIRPTDVVLNWIGQTGEEPAGLYPAGAAPRESCRKKSLILHTALSRLIPNTRSLSRKESQWERGGLGFRREGGGTFRSGEKRIRLLYERSTLAVGRGEILPPCASGCMS